MASEAVKKAAAQVAEDLHLIGLTSEEEPLLPAASTQKIKARYVATRNLILYIWRSDVSQHLTLQAARRHAYLTRRPPIYVDIAWHFLNVRGYINFGVAPDLLAHAHSTQAEAASQEQHTVIVIGAGLAGLGAAQQLLKLGLKVVVLEAKAHPGGRVHTVRLEGQGHECVADLGGAVITGVNGNPLAVLARQLGIPLHRIDAEQKDCPLYQSDGSVVTKSLDSLASKVFLEAEEASLRVPEQYSSAAAEALSFGTFLRTQLAGKDTAGGGLANMLRWLYSNAEFSAAALATELSVTRWSDDDHFGFSGDHAWLPGGNVRLVKALCQDVPIVYNTAVSEVHYGGKGVTVTTTGGHALAADACIVTVPLGVLKARHIAFEPPLPPRKQAAIDRLGFGVLNKVVLLFAEQWWPQGDTFGHVADKDEEPGWCYLWYCFPGLSGGHMISALVAGQAAIDLEAQSDSDILARVLRRLRVYHPDCTVPDPVSAAVTHWGADPHTLGSYSSVPPGCAGAEDYNEVSRNVEGRVFFAGEATSSRYPAQMHGAYDSGLREMHGVYDSGLRQAAKVHAAFSAAHMSSLSTGAAATAAANLADGRPPDKQVGAVARALMLRALLQQEFERGCDASGHGWQALLALAGSPGVREWAVLRLRYAELLKGRTGPPIDTALHIVPIEAVVELDEAKHSAGHGPSLLDTLHRHGVRGLHSRAAPTEEEIKRMEGVLAARTNGYVPELQHEVASALQQHAEHLAIAQEATAAGQQQEQ